ncbi:hypothetical protein SCUCBS95973_007658 [Sporothrix curviconia]|uniref:F-box domain-containing protein n=1 Tax=Sporothrix curviconia TaxID=1260050 RepID=A0ABP0CF31_9PEZI
MSARSRQRAAAQTAGGWSATSLSLRSSHGRATRHAPVLNYAEPSESEDAEEEDDDIDELQADQVQGGGNSDTDEPSSQSDSDEGDGEPGDKSFRPGHRPPKRSLPADALSPEAGSSKRRRQPHRRATADFLTGDDAYLSPSSDGAPRTRRKQLQAAASAASSATPAEVRRASTSSPQSRNSRHGRGRRDIRTPTKQSKHVVIDAGGKRDGVRTPILKRAVSPPRSNRPPWATLPYFVLADIFAYGAGELDTIASVRWLLGVSRTCRGFAEPALRALYRSPPMLTMNMAHNLVEHLAKDPSTTMFDYRQKVKTLRIDVGSLASRVYRGRHLDIPRLVSYCPGLVDLDLYHYKDMPPYREQTENLRWSYPEALFEILGAVPPRAKTEEAGGDALEEGTNSNTSVASNPAFTSAPASQEVAAPLGVKLRSWRWNQRLMGPDLTLDRMRTMHLSPTFASLRKISFVNYQRPSLSARDPEDPAVIEADRQHAEDFTSLLNALPHLTHLSIESSTAANDLILPLMPTTLQRLELINCWDVTADQFAEYLVTHGQALKELTLNYNQSLSLSFLSVLGTSCPQLQVLRMNLTYYSQHASYNDANPNYETLLTPDQVPAWPTGIQVIELEHLRKWEPDAAEVFFNSLVDSAPHMSDLRVLAIKAMLDIPWRQRCEMRDRWEATLDRVFKRRVSPPAPAHSLSYYAKQKRQNASPRSKAKARQFDSEPARRSHRIATHVSSPSSRSSSKSRGLRYNIPGGRVSYREPDTDEDIPSSDDLEDEKKGNKNEENRKDENIEQGEGEGKTDEEEMSGGEGPSAQSNKGQPFVHGMCDVVDIRIDNQKPGEIQYRMVDFLDSDDSGSDDEWTGDGVEANDYAW